MTKYDKCCKSYDPMRLWVLSLAAPLVTSSSRLQRLK